jgi:hypothetical protein
MSEHAELIRWLRGKAEDAVNNAGSRATPTSKKYFEAADALSSSQAEIERLRGALADVMPFVPLGYAPTGRPGGADERNRLLAEARAKADVALSGQPGESE